MSYISNLTIELIIGFFALLIITKVLGKTQINQITPFEFISSLVLGELVGNAVYDKDINTFYILYAVCLWALLLYIIEMLTEKFKGTRSFFEGKPSILIRNGQIDFNELKKEKIDINELQSLLRSKDVFSIREIQYAILESNGSISVLKKSKYDNPTNEDLNLPEKPVYLPISIILDGEVLWDNIQACGFDEKWLKKQLHTNKISKIKEIFYAEWKKDEGLHIIKKSSV
ncbi:DUF421 domain-containing protein [Tepidibacter hydrothermalis]|uniref:DUF421 domain-containing protein n=1 Tax=Tepidibacter hydrothermalis TaxID=3036126 RepID=A0ABY8E948_9FIRM|nr:DUF421 domain-containing protein [Tepidibacter hydrothermalis]WFD09412.1 DUF421 domain-containing protein [Tepidibacter hydrothermalis]